MVSPWNLLLLLLPFTFSPYPGPCTIYFGSPVVPQWWNQLLGTQSFPKSLRSWHGMVEIQEPLVKSSKSWDKFLLA